MKATDVYALVHPIAAFALPEEETVLRICDQALTKVVSHLKAHISEDDPRVAMTAAALARFDLFVLSFGDTDRFQSFKAGDLTVTQDRKAALDFETHLRQQALCDAAEILADGGFCFEAV